MSEPVIKSEHVSKQYRLGAIGGGTLRGDLQSWAARVRGKEDPNAAIGAKAGGKNERFMALENISFEVRAGERLGIIGHNGAGKSTLLKLLSRVTAPTEGTITYKGRIASMLEVGTGFHPELTGRENVYLNGAILGMTKAEIAKKFDEIVEFAEMRQFIETPVKRYSSGMYVKLAFAVAAHLDSEILVMDEVLAVGDMKFQQKCLGKMGDVSKEDGRTVLYVSHNMNTIRQLCTRCLVLDHGRIIFDGDVDKAVEIYSKSEAQELMQVVELENKNHTCTPVEPVVKMTELRFDLPCATYSCGDTMKVNFKVNVYKKCEGLMLRLVFNASDDTPAAMANTLKPVTVSDNTLKLNVSLQGLAPGKYKLKPAFYLLNEFGTEQLVDVVADAAVIEVVPSENDSRLAWNKAFWGHLQLPYMEVRCD